MNGSLHVSRCPIDRWHSEPCDNEDAAKEAARAHINTHRFGELVDFAAAVIEVDRYVKEPHAIAT